MEKKSVFVVILVFVLTALLQAEVMAASTLVGGGARTTCRLVKDYPPPQPPNPTDKYCCNTWCFGCYSGSWIVVGGSNPNDEYSTIINTTGVVLSDAFVCTNPGGDFDVRNGLGGTIFDLGSPVTPENTVTDENGRRIIFTDSMCSRIGEDVPSPGNPSDLHQCTQEEFASVWGVGDTPQERWSYLKSFCRNDNWDPYEYLIRSVELTGTLYNGCFDVPACEGLSGTAYLDCICAGKSNDAQVFCETKENFSASWPGDDDQVDYTCVELGNPIAWSDSYSVRANRTLSVKAPGVLSNDHDTGLGATRLTASLTENVASGTLDFHSDGSFTYVAGSAGPVSFKYRPSDNSGNIGNEAEVIIAVN